MCVLRADRNRAMLPAMSPDRGSSDNGPDSQHLLDEARRGKQAALQSLLVRHLEPLRAFVRLQVSPRLRERETESDLVQSVCLEVLQRADRFEFRGETEFRGWLYRAVLHAVRDGDRYHKAQRRASEREIPIGDVARLAELYATVSSPSQRAVAREEVDRIEQAFTRLPERYSEVLALVHIAGLSRPEVAAQLHVSPDAASKLLKRAAVRLARELGAR